MIAVRHSVECECFEGRCQYCGDWWPLTEEFWPKAVTVQFCRACLQAKKHPIRVGITYRQYVRAGGQLDYISFKREYKRLWMQMFRARRAA